MRIQRMLLITFVAIFIFFSFPFTSLAQESLEIQQKIYPGNKFYVHKRLWDKVRETLTLTADGQIKLHKRLLVDRFSELKYVSNKNLAGEYEKSSQRFSSEAGLLTERVITQNNDDSKKELIELFNKYKEELSKIRDKNKANSAFWLLIQQNIDSLVILASKLG